MTRDLLLPVEILGVRTLRDTDGLALSSRNAYLSQEERARALGIARGLSAAVSAFESGERLVRTLREAALEQLSEAGLRLDYLTLADADELEPIPDEARILDRALLAVAGFVSTTRLIDNVVLGEDPAPIASSKKLAAW